MKINKNIWGGKNKPYNQNSLHFPNGVNSGGGSSSGDGEEYGPYLKILDVDGYVDSGWNNVLTINSPEVIDFFSDVPFSRGYNNEYTFYEHVWSYVEELAVEKKKKELGYENYYDTLQKKLPILAIRTKRHTWDDGSVNESRVLILNSCQDKRESDGTYYCVSNHGHNHPACEVTFSSEGINIWNVE